MAEEENCSKDLGEVSKELKFLAFLLEASSMYRLSLIFSLISEFLFFTLLSGFNKSYTRVKVSEREI